MEATKKRKTKFQKWCKYSKRYLKEFCEMSSIQGLSYIVKDVSIVERIWWIIVLILSFWGSCYMVANITDKWFTTPVLVSLATREMHIKDVPFPAVTICPESKVSHKCLNYTQVLLDRKKGEIFSTGMIEHLYFDLMALMCRNENHEGTIELMNEFFLKNFNLTSTSSGEEGTDEVQLNDYWSFFQECSTVDLNYTLCQWMGKTVDCEKVLTRTLTDEGLCYSFNMFDLRDLFNENNDMEYLDNGNRHLDWDPDVGYTEDPNNLRNLYPRRAFLSGSKNAFVAVFTTNKDDIEYACRDFSIQGIRVSIHNPTVIPKMGQVFFSVGLDRLTTVAVKPTLTKTSEKIVDYAPHKRNCYFGYERHLKFFRFYSQANCNLECFTNYTAAHCGCVSFYMPRDNKTNVCSLKERFCLEHARLNYTQDILRERLKSNGGSKHSIYGKTTNCHCLPLCSELTYNAEIDGSDWDFRHPDEVVLDHIKNNLSNYHASAVKVFFKNSFFLPTQRDELYGLSDMVSNVGGALGLISGFSIVSLAEIVYFLSIKLIDNLRLHGYWTGARTPNQENENNSNFSESIPMEILEEVLDRF